jgi:hypothetical protein
MPSFTTVMQCSTSMVGVFEATSMLASRAQLVMAGAELHHKTVGSVRGQSLAIMNLAVTVFFLCGTSGNCLLAEPFLSHRFPDQRADAR